MLNIDVRRQILKKIMKIYMFARYVEYRCQKTRKTLQGLKLKFARYVEYRCQKTKYQLQNLERQFARYVEYRCQKTKVKL